jgi:biopolymer transport protein ExbD
MKIREVDQADKSLSSTSLIDIVFLLLVFFLLTFKIVETEGDFSVRMPLQTGQPPAELPLMLQLRANEDGTMSSMSLNEVELGTDFDKLRGKIVSILGEAAAEHGDGPELEIDSDYHLRYAHVIDAITAVSGYRDGDRVVHLIDKVKFAQPPR